MEADFIHWLRQRLPEHAQLLLGPGDDAAILRMTERTDLVVTSDLLTDGIDFLVDQCKPAEIGRKALAVNLSDLAAMASKPVGVLVSLALPRNNALAIAQGLFNGMLPLAAAFDVAIAGGDTNTWDHGLVISITAFGETTPAGSLTRSGGAPGDQILVTGRFGGSILGKHFDFEPRVYEALLLNERYSIHAAIDVSDGLSLDLFRLAEASRCGAAIVLEHVPIAAAAHQLARASGDQLSPLDHALCDGEDFELILVAPPETANQILTDQPLSVPVTRIGEMVNRSGLWQLGPEGDLRAMEPKGFEH